MFKATRVLRKFPGNTGTSAGTNRLGAALVTLSIFGRGYQLSENEQAVAFAKRLARGVAQALKEEAGYLDTQITR